MEATLERWKLLAPLRHRALALLVAAGVDDHGDGQPLCRRSAVRGAPGARSRELHGGSGGYGLIIALFSVGAVGGALVAGSIKPPRRPGLVLSATAVGAMAALAVLPYLGTVWGAGLAFAVTGSLLSSGNLLAITAFQRWAPPHLLGRIMGLILFASVGTYPVSVIVGGVLVHAVGAVTVFPIAAAGGITAILIGLTSRAWREFSVDTQADSGNATRLTEL